MPFQSVPQCAEAVIRGNIGGKEVVNVLTYSFGASYGASDIAALAATLDGYFEANYPPLCNGDVIYSGVTVRGLENVNDFESTSSSGPTPGTKGALPLPSNTTMCITERSNLTGRSARGRFYAWPTGSDNLDTPPDTFISAYASALVTLLTGADTAAAVLGWLHVIVSRFTGGAQRPTGVVFAVTDISARNLTCDSQRGRLPKGH